MSTDTPTTEMTAEERAERVLQDEDLQQIIGAMHTVKAGGVVISTNAATLRDRIAREITEAEQAAELRGAERMREQLWHAPNEEMEAGQEILVVHDNTFSVGYKRDFDMLNGFNERLVAWCYRKDLIATALAALPLSKEKE